MRWSRARERLEPFLPALRVARFVLAVILVAAMLVVAVRYVPFGSLTWWMLVPALAGALFWWTLLARGWAILASGHAARQDMGMWCRTQVLRYLPMSWRAACPEARIAQPRASSVHQNSAPASAGTSIHHVSEPNGT